MRLFGIVLVAIASLTRAEDSDVVTLTTENFDVSSGDWLVEFYAVSKH